MTRKSPELAEVAGALRQLLRRGLPSGVQTAEAVLLELRGVVARAAAPDEPASRADALDSLLRQILARFEDTRYAPAARALFGLGPAEPGQNLTVRREAAAGLAGHEVNHFRKRVEPRLVETVAHRLLTDAEAFRRTRAIAPRLTVPQGRQLIPADPFAWEVVEHEATLSELWAAIYALRSELLTVERLVSLGVSRDEAVPRVLSAAWLWAQATRSAESYIEAYATGESAVSLVSLAGWTPDLTEAQTWQLVDAAADAGDRTAFILSTTGLTDTWIEPFFKHDTPIHGESSL